MGKKSMWSVQFKELNIPWPQSLPIHPSVQAQLNFVLLTLVHTPPLLHGAVEQGSASEKYNKEKSTVTLTE